jgi:trimethylamine-N-oxide reductase cytochrome c-type subunit TorC
MAGAVFFGVFQLSMKVTDNIAFCTSCHSMGTAYQEYQESAHYRNVSGVRAICTDCHVPSEWGPYVLAKIEATRDLVAEVRGTIDTPEKFAAKRLELAQRVWARMEASDSRECRSCHSHEAMVVAAQVEDAQAQHPRAITKGETCIDCHKGLVHAMPDLGPLAQVAFANLEATLGKVAADAGTVHSLATQPFFLDAGGETRGGQVLAGIPLAAMESADGMVKVRLSGWRQEGADRVLYAEAGKRILIASLSSDAQEALQSSGDSVVLEDTGQTWTPGTLEGWLPVEKLTADTEALWEYAGALYSTNCSLCHALPHANEFAANLWMGQLQAMVPSTSLEKDEARLVQTYLQLHAADMGGH